MVIYIGADHRGFELKKHITAFLKNSGYQVVDVGNVNYDDKDDYPDFASSVASSVSSDYENSRGVVICGSGIGVSIVANKFPKVRCALAMTSDQAFDSRNDADANMLAIAANYTTPEDAKKIITTWLGTPFSAESRHQRRIDKISQVELFLEEQVRNQSK